MERSSPPPGHFPPQDFPYLLQPQQFDYQRDRFLAVGRDGQQPPFQSTPNVGPPTPAPPPSTPATQAPVSVTPAAPPSPPPPLQVPGGPPISLPATPIPPPARPSPTQQMNRPPVSPNQTVTVHRTTRTIITPGLAPLSETRFSKISNGMRESLVTTVGRNVSIRALFMLCHCRDRSNKSVTVIYRTATSEDILPLPANVRPKFEGKHKLFTGAIGAAVWYFGRALSSRKAPRWG